MTGQLAYDAHTARYDEFRRRADEHRRAGGLRATRRMRTLRLAGLVTHRRRRGTTRTASTAA
jgi:hypothetical protein